jgi:hypothetical protein
MAQIVPPKPNPLMEAMAKLLKEKAPGVVDAVERLTGPENPPVNMMAKLLAASDPMGVMGMGMAMGPLAKGMVGKTYELGTPVKNASGLPTRAVRVLEEGRAGRLRLADMENQWNDMPLLMRAKALKESGKAMPPGGFAAYDAMTGKEVARAPTHELANEAAVKYYKKQPPFTTERPAYYLNPVEDAP